LKSIVKRHGLIAFCKLLVDDQKNYGVSEHELVEAITDHAKDAHPGMSPDQAFAKVFAAQTEEGALLRRAVAIAKDMMTLTPVFVGGEAVNPNDAHEAYTQLMELAEEQRARAPWKTVAQAFADVFQDPANAELAARAHRRPAATTTYPFPR
jgi:hypothetical protein